MKYFIDFEMLSPDYRIGQIGCVNIKGEELFIHVTYNNSEIAKIARNILKDTIMTPDDAFSALFDWIYKDETGKPEIYCWGDKDADYAKVTMNYMSAPKAKMMALYLHHNLINYHLQFLDKYGRSKNMKLEHAAKLLDPTIKQAHIAIEDAKILRMVYLLSDTFPIYPKENVITGKIEKQKPRKAKVLISINENTSNDGSVTALDKKKELIASFSTIDEAADWIIANGYVSIKRHKMIAGSIKHAIETGIQAYKFYWSIK